MKVSAILKGSKDAHNRQPVCLRKANGKSRTFKIIKGMRASKDDFDKGKIKSSHPHYKDWNKIIQAEIEKFENDELMPKQNFLKLLSITSATILFLVLNVSAAAKPFGNITAK
jgi:NADPH-dependent curcumin reductase CurA